MRDVLLKWYRSDRVWFIAGLFVLAWVILVNRFPDGFVIAGEDTAQFIDQSTGSFRMLWYEWQGRAALYFSIFFVLDWLGVSNTGQLSWYLGIFLVGSYVSFHAFVRLLFPQVDRVVRFLAALFYALNLYTLYVFTYDWGYSHYQSLYIFIPVLFGLYIRFLQTRRLIFGVWFALILFVSSSGFANPAFALSLGIVMMLITILLWMTRAIAVDRDLIKKMSIVVIAALATNAYWIASIVLQVQSGVADIAATNSIDLAWWLQFTSNPIIDTLRLMQFNGDSFFPINFTYGNYAWMKNILIVMTCLPFVFLLFGLLQKKTHTYTKLFWVFSALFAILIMLVARVRPPFEKFNDFFFQIGGINTLRSYEKLAIFTPFILATIFVLILLQNRTKKYFSWVIIFFVFILAIPIPFYKGKLQQDMSFPFAQGKERNYMDAKYSFLLKIPQEYRDIETVVDKDSADVKMASLPYNVIGSLGWANYPKWKLQGSDITALMYDKKMISPNGAYFNTWLYAKEFNESNADPAWIARMLGMMNVKYVIYHKDADQKFIEQSEKKVSYLEEQKLFIPIAENDYFTLYCISPNLIAPHVFWSNDDFDREDSAGGILSSTDDIQTKIHKASYDKVHPKKIVVDIDTLVSQDTLILNEPYNAYWDAEYRDSKGEKVALKHVHGLDYANGWKLTKDMKEGVVTITYRPYEWFVKGIWISLGALVISISYSIRVYIYGRKKTSNR